MTVGLIAFFGTVIYGVLRWWIHEDLVKITNILERIADALEKK